jgi:hypothetical protein
MATLDNLEISYNRKVQLKQFEPVTVGAVADFTLEPDDDPYEVYEQGQRSVQNMVERELAYRIARKKQVELGPSIPKIKAVIHDHTEVLDDDTVAQIAEDIVDE